MGKMVFILGGSRSGKSRHAIELARKSRVRKVAFIATSEALDKEMTRRIALHKKMRPSNWVTFEEPLRVSALIEKIGKGFNVIIIDCLTLLVSNLMLKRLTDAAIEAEIEKILKSLKQIKRRAIIVSNEVGLGIVPRNRLSRRFRDASGTVNRMVAESSDEVLFMVSGIPWRIK